MMILIANSVLVIDVGAPARDSRWDFYYYILCELGMSNKINALHYDYSSF